MRERDIERYLVRRVKELGGEVRKVQWIARAGAPDRLVMVGSHHFWVELKAPGKTAEPHQLREHARMRKYGMKVVVVDSIEWIDAMLGVPRA